MLDTRPHARRPLSSLLVPALGALALIGLAACGGEGGDGGAADTAGRAGEAPPSAGSGGPAVVMELRRIQKELGAIRDTAMQDASLRRQLEEVRTMVDSTIRQISSRAGQQMDRLDSLSGELQAARSEQDTARLRSLAEEARKLRRALQEARSKAMERDEVAAAVEDFRSALRARMREVAPRTDSLVDRADSLRRQMQSGMGGPGAGADTAGPGAGTDGG